MEKNEANHMYSALNRISSKAVIKQNENAKTDEKQGTFITHTHDPNNKNKNVVVLWEKINGCTRINDGK